MSFDFKEIEKLYPGAGKLTIEPQRRNLIGKEKR